MHLHGVKEGRPTGRVRESSSEGRDPKLHNVAPIRGGLLGGLLRRLVHLGVAGLAAQGVGGGLRLVGLVVVAVAPAVAVVVLARGVAALVASAVVRVAVGLGFAAAHLVVGGQVDDF